MVCNTLSPSFSSSSHLPFQDVLPSGAFSYLPQFAKITTSSSRTANPYSLNILGQTSIRSFISQIDVMPANASAITFHPLLAGHALEPICTNCTFLGHPQFGQDLLVHCPVKPGATLHQFSKHYCDTQTDCRY